MLESNPPRNSRLQTHRNDGRGDAAKRLRPLLQHEDIGLIDLPMPQKTQSMTRMPRLLVAATDPSLRRSRPRATEFLRPARTIKAASTRP